ncbi:site-specific tyrosine recombinase XerD [uncultured Blautia sp.]|jgi:integrase|uniref:Site-specific tyrosine recombinase XerC n=3 Tax=Blautia hydrogenotrophica TaxID=53443 RepID=C0CR53_BLAHS|nr:site-specific recombinase, phage integrase family [Blautia hydrogenotrophica DSM 10507]SCI34344.1 site-specific tyrosine recombinase XerD [uncultured Blautia sp.]DAU19103.1 MAG TPA: Integrase [Caudoviricetes sp.]
MEDRDLLQYALEHDMISMSYIQEQVNMNKRKEILEKHPYKIWEGKDGKWRTYILDENGKRILKKLSTKKAVQNIIVSYYENIEKAKTEDYSFHSYFQKWKEKQVSYGVSNNTLTKYDSDYKRYFENSKFEKLDIRKINEEDITAFVIQQIKKLNLKEKAGKSLMGYINGVFKHARIKRIISENPCEYVETRNFSKFFNRDKKNPEERTINTNDLNLLLKQLYISQTQKPHYIPNYAVELAIYTGMRIGEITALRWENIREDLGVIVICCSEKHDRITKEYIVDSTKTRKERQFPITQKISSLLYKVKKIEMQYGFLGEYIFQNENGKLHSSSIAHCIRYRCIQAGIPEKSIQSLRRTLNSKLRCAGVSSIVAASMLGHTEEVNALNYSYDISEMDYKREILSEII